MQQINIYIYICPFNKYVNVGCVCMCRGAPQRPQAHLVGRPIETGGDLVQAHSNPRVLAHNLFPFPKENQGCVPWMCVDEFHPPVGHKDHTEHRCKRMASESARSRRSLTKPVATEPPGRNLANRRKPPENANWVGWLQEGTACFSFLFPFEFTPQRKVYFVGDQREADNTSHA